MQVLLWHEYVRSAANGEYATALAEIKTTGKAKKEVAAAKAKKVKANFKAGKAKKEVAAKALAPTRKRKGKDARLHEAVNLHGVLLDELQQNWKVIKKLSKS